MKFVLDYHQRTVIRRRELKMDEANYEFLNSILNAVNMLPSEYHDFVKVQEEYRKSWKLLGETLNASLRAKITYYERKDKGQ